MSEERTRNKSKEEIALGMQRVQEAKRLRAFVKDKLYPAIITTSTSIDDAKFLLGSFSNMMMEQFLAKMKETKFIELKLHEKLDKNSPKYKEFIELLALFADENVFTSRELIEGMKNEITMFIDNELKGRKLETLKTNFLE
jgi:hypothetical protein